MIHNEIMLELAERAIKCHNFRWLPGMKELHRDLSLGDYKGESYEIASLIEALEDSPFGIYDHHNAASDSTLECKTCGEIHI